MAADLVPGEPIKADLVPGEPIKADLVPGEPIKVDLVPGEPIKWEDPNLIAGLDALRELPGGAAALSAMGCDYLVATHLASAAFDAEQALETILVTVEWRQVSGAAAARLRLSQEQLEFDQYPHCRDIVAHMPMHESDTAVCLDGLPLATRCLGMVNSESLFEKVTKQEMLDWQLFVSEARLTRLEAYARRTGKLGYVTLVQDMTCPGGLMNLWQKNASKRGMMSEITHKMDTHYPGMLGRILLTSAPWALQAIMTVLYPVLPARIAEKIEIVAVANTAPRMRELVDPTVLPRFLGGDVPDKDFVPTREVCTEAGGEELLVGARTGDERGMPMEEGSVASYGFTIDDEMDILFSVRFDRESGDSQEVRAPERVQEATGGIFTAPSRGRFVLVFDNSYSWINAKTVRFECAQLLAEELETAAASLADQG